MDDENLEGTENNIEGTKATEKGAPPTQEPKTPTLKYSEEDFQRSVTKASESTQRQLDLTKAEAQTAKAELGKYTAQIASYEAQIQEMQKEVDEVLTDDPDRRKAYTSRLANLERERKIAEKDAKAEQKLYDAELRVWQAGMGLKAQELKTEFPDLDLDVKQLIANSVTEEEMENKVLRLASKQPAKEPEKTPKFDSGISSGGGGRNLENMSGRELIKLGIQQKRKK